VKRPSR